MSPETFEMYLDFSNLVQPVATYPYFNKLLDVIL